jgi:hypothetical protein
MSSIRKSRKMMAFGSPLIAALSRAGAPFCMFVALAVCTNVVVFAVSTCTLKDACAGIAVLSSLKIDQLPLLNATPIGCGLKTPPVPPGFQDTDQPIAGAAPTVQIHGLGEQAPSAGLGPMWIERQAQPACQPGEK